MIKITDNTGLSKKKEIPAVPFFIRGKYGSLYLVYEKDNGNYNCIGMVTGYEQKYNFTSLEEMFAHPDLEGDKIVKVELIVSNCDE